MIGVVWEFLSFNIYYIEIIVDTGRKNFGKEIIQQF